jgi:ADP-ribose pyrophosphatase YjhB (NUDIX family)
MTYLDPAGKSLLDYPRPSVAVDTALLTIAQTQLLVLLVRAPDPDPARAWRLPGTFLHVGETLEDAVVRSLAVKAGVAGLRPQQLHVFDDPRRDDRGRVLSVAHLDVVKVGAVPMHDGNRLVPVADVPDLPFDHAAIIGFAVRSLQNRYRAAPDPFDLVDAVEPDGSFTLRELRLAHEAVAGHRLAPDSFRRAMRGLLEETGHFSVGRRGKPAELYRRRTELHKGR